MRQQFGIDLDNARHHRERDKTETNQFYDAQARAVAQWHLGEPKPESVIVGELPYMGQVDIIKNRGV